MQACLNFLSVSRGECASSRALGFDPGRMERGQRSDAALRLRCSQLRRAEAEDSVLAGSRRGCERSLPATVGIPRLSELMPGVQVQYSCYSGHGLSRQGRPQGRSEAQLPNWLTQRFFVYTLPRKKAAWLSCFAAGVPNCRQS